MSRRTHPSGASPLRAPTSPAFSPSPLRSCSPDGWGTSSPLHFLTFSRDRGAGALAALCIGRRLGHDRTVAPSRRPRASPPGRRTARSFLPRAFAMEGADPSAPAGRLGALHRSGPSGARVPGEHHRARLAGRPCSPSYPRRARARAAALVPPAACARRAPGPRFRPDPRGGGARPQGRARVRGCGRDPDSDPDRAPVPVRDLGRDPVRDRGPDPVPARVPRPSTPAPRVRGGRLHLFTSSPFTGRGAGKTDRRRL